MECARCKGPLPAIAGGAPFSDGPYKGGYWCQDCWIIYYADHPEHCADDETLEWMRKHAREVKTRRREGLEVLWREGDSAIYLNERGTFLIDIEPMACGGEWDEYDPERARILWRALEALIREFPNLRDLPEA